MNTFVSLVLFPGSWSKRCAPSQRILADKLCGLWLWPAITSPSLPWVTSSSHFLLLLLKTHPPNYVQNSEKNRKNIFSLLPHGFGTWSKSNPFTRLHRSGWDINSTCHCMLTGLTVAWEPNTDMFEYFCFSASLSTFIFILKDSEHDLIRCYFTILMLTGIYIHW